MKKFLLALATLFCVFTSQALSYDCDFYDEDGLGYRISGEGTVSLSDAWGPNESPAIITDLVVPETVTFGNQTYTVTGISSYIFVPYLLTCEDQDFTYPYLKSLTIPNTVKRISDYAFVECISLETVDLGNGVETLGSSFIGCTSLKNVRLPKTLKSIVSRTFTGTGIEAYEMDDANPYFTVVDGVLYDKNVTRLISYPTCKAGAFSVPESVTSMNESAFGNCTKLTNLFIGDQVKNIGVDLLYCSSVEQVRLPNTLKTIPSCTFEGCEKLKSIEIPESVTKINFAAFCECTSLESVKMGENVDSICSHAFTSCHNLHEININARYVDDYAFHDCTNLKCINFGKDIANISFKWFKNCNSLKTITVAPENPNYKMVGSCLMTSDGTILVGVMDNTLKMLALPEGTTEINSYAFEVTHDLSLIYVPKSVTKFGDYLFHHLPAKAAVFCNASTLHSVTKNTFTDKPIGLTFYFNTDLYNKALATAYWKTVQVKKKHAFADMDGNSSIDVLDMNMMINLLIGKTDLKTNNVCVYPDLNLDNSVDVGDLNMIMGIISDRNYSLYYEPFNPSSPVPAGCNWSASLNFNAKMVYGGKEDNPPYFKLLGAPTETGVCLYGDASRPGYMQVKGAPKSGRLTFNYGDPYNVNDYKFRVNVLLGLTEIKTELIKSNGQSGVQSYSCDYNADEPVVLEIINYSKSSNSQVAIWNLKVFEAQ